MWRYVDGRFIFQPIKTAIPSGTIAPDAPDADAEVLRGEENMQPGMFVKWTGIPSIAGGTVTTWKHNEGVQHATSHLALADSGCRLVAGVITNTSYTIADGGVVLAWVVKPIATILPLSGIYTHTRNGINLGAVVVNYNDDASFTFAETTSDDLGELKNRLDELAPL